MIAFDYNQTYSETLVELKSLLESRFGSILNFCNTTGIDRPNLVRTFSKVNKKDMSVGLFIRCGIHLGLMGPGAIGSQSEEGQLFNLSLRNYLKVDSVAVWRSMFALAGHKSGDAYTDAVVGMKALILKKYKTMSAFADKFDFDRVNLSRSFAQTNSKDLSVGLYIRLCVALEIMPDEPIEDNDGQLFNLTLRNYLKIDTTSVWRAILTIAHS